jgi:CubicO group peptidase (beta-lactamase class C family)
VGIITVCVNGSVAFTARRKAAGRRHGREVTSRLLPYGGKITIRQLLTMSSGLIAENDLGKSAVASALPRPGEQLRLDHESRGRG